MNIGKKAGEKNQSCEDWFRKTAPSKAGMQQQLCTEKSMENAQLSP